MTASTGLRTNSHFEHASARPVGGRKALITCSRLHLTFLMQRAVPHRVLHVCDGSLTSTTPRHIIVPLLFCPHVLRLLLLLWLLLPLLLARTIHAPWLFSYLLLALACTPPCSPRLVALRLLLLLLIVLLLLLLEEGRAL